MHFTTGTFQAPPAAVSSDAPPRQGPERPGRPTHRPTPVGQVKEPAVPKAPERGGAAQAGRDERKSCGLLGKTGPLPPGRDLRLHVDFRKGTGELVFEVRDHQTGETIRQFPPEALLEAGEELQDLRGILLDEQA